MTMSRRNLEASWILLSTISVSEPYPSIGVTYTPPPPPSSSSNWDFINFHFQSQWVGYYTCKPVNKNYRIYLPPCRLSSLPRIYEVPCPLRQPTSWPTSRLHILSGGGATFASRSKLGTEFWQRRSKATGGRGHPKPSLFTPLPSFLPSLELQCGKNWIEEGPCSRLSAIGLTWNPTTDRFPQVPSLLDFAG